MKPRATWQGWGLKPGQTHSTDVNASGQRKFHSNTTNGASVRCNGTPRTTSINTIIDDKPDPAPAGAMTFGRQSHHDKIPCAPPQHRPTQRSHLQHTSTNGTPQQIPTQRPHHPTITPQYTHLLTHFTTNDVRWQKPRRYPDVLIWMTKDQPPLFCEMTITHAINEF